MHRLITALFVTLSATALVSHGKDAEAPQEESNVPQQSGEEPAPADPQLPISNVPDTGQLQENPIVEPSNADQAQPELQKNASPSQSEPPAGGEPAINPHSDWLSPATEISIEAQFDADQPSAAVPVEATDNNGQSGQLDLTQSEVGEAPEEPQESPASPGSGSDIAALPQNEGQQEAQAVIDQSNQAESSNAPQEGKPKLSLYEMMLALQTPTEHPPPPGVWECVKLPGYEDCVDDGKPPEGYGFETGTEAPPYDSHADAALQTEQLNENTEGRTPEAQAGISPESAEPSDHEAGVAAVEPPVPGSEGEGPDNVETHEPPSAPEDAQVPTESEKAPGSPVNDQPSSKSEEEPPPVVPNSPADTLAPENAQPAVDAEPSPPSDTFPADDEAPVIAETPDAVIPGPEPVVQLQSNPQGSNPSPSLPTNTNNNKMPPQPPPGGTGVGPSSPKSGNSGPPSTNNAKLGGPLKPNASSKKPPTNNSPGNNNPPTTIPGKNGPSKPNPGNNAPPWPNPNRGNSNNGPPRPNSGNPGATTPSKGNNRPAQPNELSNGTATPRPGKNVPPKPNSGTTGRPKPGSANTGTTKPNSRTNKPQKPISPNKTTPTPKHGKNAPPTPSSNTVGPLSPDGKCPPMPASVNPSNDSLGPCWSGDLTRIKGCPPGFCQAPAFCNEYLGCCQDQPECKPPCKPGSTCKTVPGDASAGHLFVAVCIDPQPPGTVPQPPSVRPCGIDWDGKRFQNPFPGGKCPPPPGNITDPGHAKNNSQDSQGPCVRRPGWTNFMAILNMPSPGLPCNPACGTGSFCNNYLGCCQDKPKCNPPCKDARDCRFGNGGKPTGDLYVGFCLHTMQPGEALPPPSTPWRLCDDS